MEVSERGVPILSLVIVSTFIYLTYSTLHLRCRHYSIDDDKQLHAKWKQVLSQLETLKRNHSLLIFSLRKFPWLIRNSTLQLYSLPGVQLEERSPSDEYENLRRKIYSNTQELWYFVSHQLRKALNDRLNSKQRHSLVRKLADRKRMLLSDQERLPALDGHDEWRRREATIVSDLVQRRLHHLQNPPDCCAAKKLVCYHDIFGFGCNLHHLVYCLITAYVLERTLVLGHVNKKKTMHTWTNIFYPLSETCTASSYTHNATVPVLSTNTYNATVVYVPVLSIYKEAPVQPDHIPKDLAQRIARFNGDPFSWWIGQIVKYVLRLRRPDVLNDTMSRINFTSPMVGVHIRRTDKLFHEAKYYTLDEYMSHVSDYYSQLELTRTVDKRRVYIATDDANVLKEAIVRYPQYTFYGDYSKAKTAAFGSRFSSEGFNGFLVDLYMLAKCDYVVCTFSSNMGRMVYELMQTKRMDAANRFTTLDHFYHFAEIELRIRTAVIRNKNINFNVGDLIAYDPKAGSANTTGIVLRTSQIGHIPWFKTDEYVMEYPFPEYKNVPLYTDFSQHAEDNSLITDKHGFSKRK